MRRLLLLLLLPLAVLTASAQIQMLKGHVVDEADGYGIPYASVFYKSLKLSATCDGEGYFEIPFHAGTPLTASCLGYTDKILNLTQCPDSITIELKSTAHNLSEVVVKSKRVRYHRKNNPAVELMRRVIAQKHKTDLDRHDYYAYTKYQKLTFSRDKIDTTKTDKKPEWFQHHIDQSPYNGQFILPISVDETITKQIYRKDPKKEKTIVVAQRSAGVNKIIQTGDILNTMLKEVFTDVNIYDNYIRLLQYPFPSPIGSEAISFYHYFIQDTVKVDRDSCYHVLYYPANHQDFGFQGDLYITKDSALQVKRCTLKLPKQSGVNFVQNMNIIQQFDKLSNGQWVLSQDDMAAEVNVVSIIPNLLVVRNTRMQDYSFDPISKKEFRGAAAKVEQPSARVRSSDYWASARPIPLTNGEGDIDYFTYRLTKSKNFGWAIVGLQMFVENYIETSKPGHKNYFDIGPINTVLSSNFVDGARWRLSGRTTANLNSHLFWTGWGAYGAASHQWYYGSKITYSFNKKELAEFEYPIRDISFESTRDLMSPADKFLVNNKDNIFESWRTQTVRQMYFFNRQKLSFKYESENGLSFDLGIKTESNQVAGDLHFVPVNNDPEIFKIRTTELNFGIDYHPNQTYINTKQRRWPVNFDAPEISLTHNMGLNHFLGGQYNYNITELSLYKRQWLGSFGYINLNVIGRAEWNKAPFPLLLMPPVSLSYVADANETTFNLMRNMEFITDRHLYWSAIWDLNGKIFNRLPLIKKLKWRELIGFKGMWGHLTDKNNPEKNPGDNKLFRLPEGSHVIGNQPYMEFLVGVHNIFKFFGVDYVRRLTYNDNPDVTRRWGLRFNFMMSF